METNYPEKCPVCNGPVQSELAWPHVIVFKCCNTWSAHSRKWVGVCDNSYAVALKYSESLKFYASAMASDLAYDGGAKARVALLPVV